MWVGGMNASVERALFLTGKESFLASVCSGGMVPIKETCKGLEGQNRTPNVKSVEALCKVVGSIRFTFTFS